jgi:hypothetical protein
MSKSKLVLPSRLHIVKGAVRVPTKSLGAVSHATIGNVVPKPLMKLKEK